MKSKLQVWTLCRSYISRFVLLSAGLAGPANAELIGFYSFDNAADAFHDDSGKGADLASAGADPVYQAAGGFTGGGFVFNGNQRLLTSFDIFWEEPAYPKLTMGAWVRTSTLSSGLRKVIGGDNGGYDRVLGLDNRTGGPMAYSTFLGTGVLGGAPSPVSTEKWTFLAVSYDQELQRAVLYVGLDAGAIAPLTVITSPTAFDASASSPTAIGSVGPNGGEGWQGGMDNIFFYNEVLTLEQLTAIRNGGKSAILGTGGADPDLTVAQTPDLRAFGKTPAEHTFSFRIKNTGILHPLAISGVALSGVDAAYYNVVRFPAAIAPGAEDTIDFKLTPQGQVGSFTASAAVASNDGGTPSLQLDLSSAVLGNALLALYTFDDAANTLRDDSGNGKTLQSPTPAEAVPVFEPAGGISGGAWSFDGVQRLISPLNIRADAVPWLTMGAWVKPSNIDSGFRKVIGNDAGWSRVIGLDPRPASGFGYSGFMGSGVFSYGEAASPVPVNMDDWTFLAASYEQPASRMTMYVDLNAAAVPGMLTSATGPASFGGGTATTSLGSMAPASSGEGWQGHIDNVFFVSGRLDAAAVKSLRDGGANALKALRPDPVLALPEASPFGTAELSGSRTVTVPLNNLGTAQPLQIVTARLTGPQAANYTLGAPPATIPPGGTANLEITFNPGIGGGIFDATLEVISNDQTNRLKTVNLRAIASFSTLKDALLAFYTFDDATSPLKDDSGLNRLLTTVEGAEPEYAAAGGFAGGTYNFLGQQRLISPVNTGAEAYPRLSMGAWVKTSILDSGFYKFIGADAGWSRVIGLDPRPEPGFGYTGFTGGGVFEFGEAAQPVPVSTEEWTFMAATYDQQAAVMTLYIDLNASTAQSGIQAFSSPASFAASQTTTAIGGLRPDNASEGWQGQVDNVFFYQTVLTPEQVTAIRLGGAPAILAANPPVPAAAFRITVAARDNAGVHLTWESLVGRSYEVQYSTNLSGVWQAAGTVTGAAGATTSWTDADAGRLAGLKGFYRVKLLP